LLFQVRVLQGRFSDAVSCHASILKLKPGDVRARLQRGLCLRGHISATVESSAETAAGTAAVAVESGSALDVIKRRLDASQGALQPGSAMFVAGATTAGALSSFDERHVWQEVEQCLAGVLLSSSSSSSSSSEEEASSSEAASSHGDLFVPCCLALGEAREVLGRSAAAIAPYELAVRASSSSSSSSDAEGSSAEPWLRLGSVYLDCLQFDATVLYLTRAVEAPGAKAATRLEGTAMLGQALTSLGDRHRAGGDGDSALAALKKAETILGGSGNTS